MAGSALNAVVGAAGYSFNIICAIKMDTSGRMYRRSISTTPVQRSAAWHWYISGHEPARTGWADCRPNKIGIHQHDKYG